VQESTGKTVTSYEENLQTKLKNLCERVHTGAISHERTPGLHPKSDGGQRALGVPALEDKIVQGTVAEVLNAIYEVDFLGFFVRISTRTKSPPGSAIATHGADDDAMRKLGTGCRIRKFFDSVDHEWLLRMLEHRIGRSASPPINTTVAHGRCSGKWRVARGCRRDAARRRISPLLANIFLHYVFDLWVHQWRRRKARGRIILVRYADDFVMGLQFADDAMRMLETSRSGWQSSS